MKDMIRSKSTLAKMLGVLFILVIFTSGFGGAQINSLTTSTDIATNMISISENSPTMELAIVVDLFTSVGIVLMGALLYSILKKQNHGLAIGAFALWILEAVTMIVSRLFAYALLLVSQEFAILESSYLESLGNIFHELMQYSYTVHMFFYCLGGLIFYYLFYKSKSIPRPISILGILAVAVGLGGIIFTLFSYEVSMFIFLPILPFELSIGIWLISKGIKA